MIFNNKNYRPIHARQSRDYIPLLGVAGWSSGEAAGEPGGWDGQEPLPPFKGYRLGGLGTLHAHTLLLEGSS